MKAPDNRRNAPGREGRTYCVYKHTLPDGRCYIGATYRGTKRWGEGGCKYKSSKVFYSLIAEYGWNNIKHEILFDGLSSEEARKKERQILLEAKIRGISLNDVSGGYNSIYKEKMHEIIGLRQLGLSYPEIAKLYGVSPDTVARIYKRKSYLNYYSEIEFEKKVRDFVSLNKGKYQRKDGLTPNHNGHLAKRIVKKEKDGSVIERYESITVAAEKNRVSISAIANNLKRKSKLCGGYKYEYD